MLICVNLSISENDNKNSFFSLSMIVLQTNANAEGVPACYGQSDYHTSGKYKACLGENCYNGSSQVCGIEQTCVDDPSQNFNNSCYDLNCL